MAVAGFRADSVIHASIVDEPINTSNRDAPYHKFAVFDHTMNGDLAGLRPQRRVDEKFHEIFQAPLALS